MKYRDLLKLIHSDGWVLRSQKGSHAQYVHPVKPGRVTVAGHRNHDVPPKTLASVLKQAQIEGEPKK
jgi:predicted RNA binding protein YcfA (HicA-like mRNA interferase family)